MILDSDFPGFIYALLQSRSPAVFYRTVSYPTLNFGKRQVFDIFIESLGSRGNKSDLSVSNE